MIFVALAVAWAAYLIPKALEHHEESAASRTVATFSHRIRVLARREPISTTKARLVTTAAAVIAGANTSGEMGPQPHLSARTVRPFGNSAERRAHNSRPITRRAIHAATMRRRRVLEVLLAITVGFVVSAFIVKSIAPDVVVLPVLAVVAWLVISARTAKRERIRLAGPVAVTAVAPEVTEVVGLMEVVEAIKLEVVAAVPATPAAADEVAAWPWVPTPAVVPTYVDKPVAERQVVALDLDATGVFSAGHNDADSAIARYAEAQKAREEAAIVSAFSRRASGA